MTARALFLAATLTLALTHAADPLPDTFKAYQERYQKLKAEIDAERDKSVGKAIADYRAELTTLLANVRQRGDLDYVVAIQNELKRTETDRSAPANPADKEMKQLRAAQWGARKIEDKANERYGERLDKLNSSYVKMLEALEKRLVAANQIDDAKLARDEQERIALQLTMVRAEHEFEIVNWEKGQAVYRGMRRVWESVPEEFEGWKVARGRLADTGQVTVDPGPSGHAYVLVPKGGEDLFGDWEKVASLRAVYGDAYALEWFVMRSKRYGRVQLPERLQEAALPLAAHMKIQD
jgi:hypothetical protein